jgi:hypothetical protein
MRKPSIHEEDAGTVTDNTPPLLPLSARNTTGTMYTQLKIKKVTLTLKRQHCAI